MAAILNNVRITLVAGAGTEKVAVIPVPTPGTLDRLAMVALDVDNAVVTGYTGTPRLYTSPMAAGVVGAVQGGEVTVAPRPHDDTFILKTLSAFVSGKLLLTGMAAPFRSQALAGSGDVRAGKLYLVLPGAAGLTSLDVGSTVLQ